MPDERFGTGETPEERLGGGGRLGGIGWGAGTIYLNSLADVDVPSPTDGLVLAYDAASGKWIASVAGAGTDVKTAVYEAGVQVGSVARAINFDGTDFNVTEEAGPGYFTVTFAGSGMATHDIVGAWHTESGITAGDVLRASAPTSFAWATLAHGDLADAPTSAHHVRYADSDVESVITAELVDGQSIDNVIDSLISNHAGDDNAHHEVFESGDFTTAFAAESLANLTTRAHGNLSDAPTDAHHNEAHALAVTGPHTGTLPLADLAVGSLGSLIRRGATDWEEFPLGTNTYVLKAGATQFDWGQVDYSELTGTQPDPVAHVLSGALHTASGLTVGDAIMADSVSTFSWQTPSYYDSFTADFAAESLANLTTRAHGNLSDAPTDAHHNEAHVLATTGPHSASLPWSDLDKTSSSLGDLATRAHTNLSDAPTDAHHSESHVLSGATHTATGLTVGWVIAADSASTFSWQAPSGGADPDAIHDNVANEIQVITGKGAPVGADVIIIEDSADSWNKKSVTITNLPGGADPDAIHDNVDNEIQVITGKGTPVGADVIIIEDSAASWAKKSVTISNLPAGSPSFGVPTGNIDIGDSAVEGSSGDSTRADHEHQFSAPGAGYPLDTANAESDGTATTPARSDHIHRLGAHVHSATAGEGGQLDWDDVWSDAVHTHGSDAEGGILTWTTALAVAAAGSHDHSDNTKGDTVPEASITFSATGHSHDGSGSENVDYTTLDNIPSTFAPAAHEMVDSVHTDTGLSVGQVIRASGASAFAWASLLWGDLDFTTSSLANLTTRAHSDLSDAPTDAHHNEVHTLATTGPHTDTLPLTDLAVGAQGSIIRRGAADWEEYVLGTEDYVLKATATDVVWGQIDFSELTGSVPSHGSSEHSAESDAEAIHDNVANEITAITAKTALVTADEFVLEDSEATFNKKAVTFGNIQSSASLANLGTRNHASLSDAPTDAHHNEAHALQTSGEPHTGSLPVTDLGDWAAQGDLIRGGAADWEIVTLGTDNFFLVVNGSTFGWEALDISLDTTPQLGGDLDLNERAILIDPSLSTNLEYEGTVLELTVSGLTVGQCVYVNGNNTGALADADAVGTMPAIGIYVGTNMVLTHGVIRQDTWGWTAGQRVYVGTDGTLTSTAPSGTGDYVQIMGIAVNVDAVMIMPSLTEVKVA